MRKKSNKIIDGKTYEQYDGDTVWVEVKDGK